VSEYQTGQPEFPSGPAEIGLEPVQVARAHALYPENQEFRRVVGVEFVQAGFQPIKLFRAGLQQQQRLRSRLHAALPTIDGLCSRNQRGAGGQPLFDQDAASSELAAVVRTTRTGGAGITSRSVGNPASAMQQSQHWGSWR